MLRRLCQTAIFAAGGIVIAQVFHLAGLGKLFLPLHIPVTLAGLLLGPWAGAIIGGFTPLISSLTTGMPALIPQALRMILELSILGAGCGLTHRRGKKPGHLSMTAYLIAAMLVSRIVLAVADTYIFVYLGRPPAPLWANIAGLVTSSTPGTGLLIVLIPFITLQVKKAIPETLAKLNQAWHR